MIRCLSNVRLISKLEYRCWWRSVRKLLLRSLKGKRRVLLPSKEKGQCLMSLSMRRRRLLK